MNLIPVSTLLDVLDEIKGNTRKAMEQKYSKLNKKLDELNRKQNGTRNLQQNKTSFHPRFVNLTTVPISEHETELLKKGLKHNVESIDKKKEVENIIVDAEMAISLIPSENQDHARHLCRRIIEKDIKSMKSNKVKSESKIIRGLKKKLETNKIIATKADKGNTTVLMYEKEYTEKTEQLIREMNCRIMRKDPTEEYQMSIKRGIKQAKTIISAKQAYTVTSMNPSAPAMIALPKIHKQGNPMRSIVNHKSAPGYKLSKHLKSMFRDKLNMPNKYIVTNTAELIERIKSVNIPREARLLSFDVKDLYASIPTVETVKILTKMLLEKTDKNIATEIINTLKVTLDQNYFKFDGKIYRQANGLGMGNPTSAILMEVFMQSLEEKYMKEITNNLGVKFYARYVDDIICVVEGNKEEQILNYLNNQHANIKFTMDTESDGRLNYLDLTVKINKEANRFEFEIYRKPTATDTVIHSSSNHPQQHKNAALRHLITRLERTPLDKEAYKKELNAVYAIAENNGYQKEAVNKIRKDLKSKKPNKKETDEKVWTVLTYTGKTSYKLAKILQKYNINTSFKTKNNVGKILQNSIDKEDPLDTQGVYKLTCECQNSYIGQTGRKIKTRYREHIRDYNKRMQKPSTIPESNFANHMVENKCTPMKIEKTAKVLHVQHKGKRLNILENMEIYKQKTFVGKIINEQINTASDTLFEPLRLLYTKRDNNLDTNANKGPQKRKITDFYLPAEPNHNNKDVAETLQLP